MNLFVDVLGWIGAAAVLVAYWMVSTHRVGGSAASYQILNAVGSVLLLVNTLYYGAYPSTFVNAAWLAIALHTMVRPHPSAPKV
ncbi:MAG: hypothetical protein A2W29_05255 [Gemmatimonadetes bacterium RBG_16_66_8]|nr:MAG: hypothetical protein A2W29_05255 [Gemmatimonadetes bacterium RBG_16_66_8]